MPPLCIAADASTSVDGYALIMRGDRTLPMDTLYATMPMIAVDTPSAYGHALSRPVSPDTSEEELYTSFEQAISDRVTALNIRLQRITRASGPAPALAPSSSSSRMACVQAPVKTTGQLRPRPRSWQPLLLLSSLALMFLLLGFDIMGLLVLHLH